MPSNTKKKVQVPVTIREKTVFNLIHPENVERVALALAMSGYYVRIAKTSGSYLLYVYTDRNI